MDQSSFFPPQTAAEWAEKMPKGPPPTSPPKETANQELLAQLHKAVGSHYHAIAQEFDNFDTMKTYTASKDEFRAICARHVQILTDEQVRNVFGSSSSAVACMSIRPEFRAVLYFENT